MALAAWTVPHGFCRMNRDCTTAQPPHADSTQPPSHPASIPTLPDTTHYIPEIPTQLIPEIPFTPIQSYIPLVHHRHAKFCQRHA
jgi:hypothetical protein